jgi:hypothetical protein
MQHMWCANGGDACQQAGLPAHRKSSNKVDPPSQAGYRRSNSRGAKERQANDPQTAGLQADYLPELDPDRGRSLIELPPRLCHRPSMGDVSAENGVLRDPSRHRVAQV